MKKMNQSLFFPFASILIFLQVASAQPFAHPTANLSTTWINSDEFITNGTKYGSHGSIMRYILQSSGTDPIYGCGFYCEGTCDAYLFAIVTVSYVDTDYHPQVVWSANRNNPVIHNATLKLTSAGDLLLRDVDGTLVWSTNTSHKSVASLKMEDTGNLVLFDVNDSVVWQSFDHPTDTLVQGQRLVLGQKLVSSPDANSTQGLYSLLVTNDGLFAFIESNPPQAYLNLTGYGTKTNKEASYVEFQSGSLDFFTHSGQPSDPDFTLAAPGASSDQFMRLRTDGHLIVYKYDRDSQGWKEGADLFSDYNGECGYPMVCGKKGICSEGQCSCPKSKTDSTNYFSQNSAWQPNLGCSEVTPLTCNASHYHRLVELLDVTYFTFRSDISDTHTDLCKEACLRNCSCKAALFRYHSDPSHGDCYLPSEIFSLMYNEQDKTGYNASAFIKVQIVPSAVSPSHVSTRNGKIGSAIGGFFLLFIIIGVTVFITRKKKNASEEEEDFLDHVPGVPNRFSHEELKIATENFSKKLGEGGFGSVFEGVLKHGTKIAVKCLDSIRQVKKSFLAEVESIGLIHHVNLVRLIGFCAEKSHRLLVYEHMANGSLDRWIYRRYHDVILDWKCRRKIIQDVAKGLAYLHEDCRQKIVHLDIKPQNILLDKNYNAKLSDFWLSKLIDRDQSQVVTTMRGTPGYLAPEWLSAVITEKVDVYSFGIVVLEIIYGRKNFEISEPEECRHLLSLFKMKAEEGRLFDLIDKRSEDMQSQGTEIVEVMQVAAWCLQSDYSKRPSMSMVVKVLEGITDVEKNLVYNFLNSQTSTGRVSENYYPEATPLLPSLLSAPR